MSKDDITPRTPAESAALCKKAEAEAEKALAEARLQNATARTAVAEARYAEIRLDREILKAKRETNCDLRNHVYRFTGSINDATCAHCIDQLSYWARTEPGCDVEIYIYTEGGGVIAGMALFDHIEYMKRMGHKVTIVAQGMAASMGGILLQAASEGCRIAGRESYILIHEISFGAGGKMGVVEDEVAFAKKIQGRCKKIFANRSKLSEKQIQDRWSRKDWWLDSDEALKLGIVDEVR